MPVAAPHPPALRSPRSEHGFTMIVAIMIMFVTSLLLVAAFTAANGDTQNSHRDLTNKQAYYAALAGVQEYEYQLEASPNYWQSCPAPKGNVTGEENESYEVTTLPASSYKGAPDVCTTAAPFESIIESKGKLINTFRIKSVGKAGLSKRTVIATFQVAGFLNYIYFTQYEVADPESYTGGQKLCGNYYPVRKELEEAGTLKSAGYGAKACEEIYFGPEDYVAGPMHTDDAANVCNGAEFGRPGHEDTVEINKGVIPASCGSGSVVYNTPTKGPIVGPEIEAPESDTSLRAYVEHSPQQNEFTGRTKLVLEGEQIKVATIEAGKEVEKTISWPKNGLIFVHASSTGCGYGTFVQESTDTASTYGSEEGCGSVYVKGTYSKSLTIAGEQDVIINGGIAPSGITPGASSAPPGTVTLGLIATRYVRIYHPCSSGSNTSGAAGSYLTEPWIYAAILSTSHSFIVDNERCGEMMGNLGVYGAIAQKFRGIVGEVGRHGYNKEYVYDERLATDEPPYFLAPLKAGWRIARETAG